MIPVSRLFSVQDHSNSLSSHTLRGIEFLEKIGSFAKERAAIEEEYAAKLRLLVRKSFKKVDEDDVWKNVSFLQGFQGILNELEHISDLHNNIGESLKNDISSFVLTKCAQHRSTRKQVMSDLSSIDDDLDSVINELYKAKKHYIRSFKEAESAFQKFTKADKNLEISRLDLEKARRFSNMKQEICEDAKTSYFKALEHANNGQKDYFENRLPTLYRYFQNLEKERVEDTKDTLQRLLNIENSAAHSELERRKSMQSCINHINPTEDSKVILESVENLIERPPTFQFEDLGDPREIRSVPIDEMDGNNRLNVLMNQFNNVKNKIKSPDNSGRRRLTKHMFWVKDDKQPINSANIDDDDYSDLPPNVRLTCLSTKIKKLEKELETAMNMREGLNKLQNAYRENGQLGNPSECDEPLIEHAKQIEILTYRIKSLKRLYSNVEEAVIETQVCNGKREVTPDTTRSVSGYSTNGSSRTNTWDESNMFVNNLHECIGKLSVSDDKDINENMSPVRSTNGMRRDCVGASTPSRRIYSPKRIKEISSPLTKTSIGSARKTTEKVAPKREEKSCMGTAKVMFSFVASTTGTISIQEGDEVYLVEKDFGDGWTRVKKKKSLEEGYVPTTYLNCSWKENV